MSPSEKVFKAWKGLHVHSGLARSAAFSSPVWLPGVRYEVGKWYRASETILSAGWGREGGDYPSGFHANVTQRAARFWGQPRRVEVKGVRTVGLQNGRKVLVADWMRILP